MTAASLKFQCLKVRIQSSHLGFVNYHWVEASPYQSGANFIPFQILKSNKLVSEVAFIFLS